MDALPLTGALGLFIVSISLGILKRRGRLNARLFAASMAAYWSIIVLTIAISHGGGVSVGHTFIILGILAVCWTVVYFAAIWLYRLWYS